jgi:hypothetical protein
LEFERHFGNDERFTSIGISTAVAAMSATPVRHGGHAKGADGGGKTMQTEKCENTAQNE